MPTNYGEGASDNFNGAGVGVGRQWDDYVTGDGEGDGNGEYRCTLEMLILRHASHELFVWK